MYVDKKKSVRRTALTAGEYAIAKTLNKAKKQNVELAKSQFALDATKLPLIETKCWEKPWKSMEKRSPFL
uniref:Uncharacterized protein n=1 Tax=Glossina palpalis gambiensis TaxID=67801 RepID=A0A1B0C4Q3_9MUSC